MNRNTLSKSSLHLSEFVGGKYTHDRMWHFSCTSSSSAFSPGTQQNSLFSIIYEIVKLLVTFYNMVWQLVSLGNDDVMELGKTAEILIFPHGTLPTFCFLRFCRKNMKQNWTFSSVGEIATHVYLVVMTCVIVSHGLELKRKSDKSLSICWNSWKSFWMVGKCKW